MLRASSLGTLLHPTRTTRRTLANSLWRKSNDEQLTKPTPASALSIEIFEKTGEFSSSTHRKTAGFQLPDPAPARPYASRPMVERNKRDYPVGNPWRKPPLPLIHRKVVRNGQTFLAGRGADNDPFDDLDLALLLDYERSRRLGVDPVAWRRDLLRVMGNTQSYLQGWMAYSVLVAVPFSIPHRHLNRLVQLIAQERTKTRELFNHLLAVLTTIHQSGWKIETHQWNALLDCAGKGLRRARSKDFRTAFNVLIDMVLSKSPGSTSSPAKARLDEKITNPVPNVHTYTTLVNHAANTRNKVALAQATSILTASGISPNRITQLVLLKFYSNTLNLHGVRITLARMRRQGKELGIDGVNACILAFSRQGRPDIAAKIYRILRHNAVPETDLGPDDIYSAERTVLRENIEIKMNMIPNEVTYTAIVQAMAYHGNLHAALAAFSDMLSSDNVEIGAPMYRDEHGKLQPFPYSPTLPVFRAIFLGFYRHGRRPSDNTVDPHPWVLGSLKNLFDVFLALPAYIQPSTSTIYWTLLAFERMSNRDKELLKSVWDRMEKHFGASWGNVPRRLERIRRSLFDETGPASGSRRPRIDQE